MSFEALKKHLENGGTLVSYMDESRSCAHDRHLFNRGKESVVYKNIRLKPHLGDSRSFAISYKEHVFRNFEALVEANYLNLNEHIRLEAFQALNDTAQVELSIEKCQNRKRDYIYMITYTLEYIREHVSRQRASELFEIFRNYKN